jgi:hypothetical protein
VSVDARIVQRNQTQRLRLASLVTRLTDADLASEVEGGWTVSAALAHLAFWDTLDVALIERWRAGQVRPVQPYWYAEAINDGMLAAWRLIPPRNAARLALDAASAIDTTVATLEDSLAEAFLARDEAWMLKRYLHRRDHIAQIERALNGQSG